MGNNQQKIIISLTSFPAAIPYAVKAIRSVINGTMLPDKIVLYLDTEKFPNGDLPAELQSLVDECNIFEVRFDPENIRSYKKLLPALKDFPEDVIVTIDDDINYHPDMLRNLIAMHKKLPNAILAHRVRKIKPNAPYKKWRKYKFYDFLFKKIHLSYLALQTGVGGVLYPPHSLEESMLKPEVFMDLAPTNDDIWFWAAAVAKGTFVVPLPNGQRTAKGVGKPREYSLMSVNLDTDADRNRIAFNKILEKYPIIKNRIFNNK